MGCRSSGCFGAYRCYRLLSWSIASRRFLAKCPSAEIVDLSGETLCREAQGYARSWLDNVAMTDRNNESRSIMRLLSTVCISSLNW